MKELNIDMDDLVIVIAIIVVFLIVIAIGWMFLTH